MKIERIAHISFVVNLYLGNSVSNTSSNTEMIRRGNEIICDYVNERFETKYPSVVAKGIRDYLMCESMLARVASHVGLKDVVLSGVSKFRAFLLSFQLKVRFFF